VSAVSFITSRLSPRIRLRKAGTGDVVVRLRAAMGSDTLERRDDERTLTGVPGKVNSLADPLVPRERSPDHVGTQNRRRSLTPAIPRPTGDF
jgi:hypothetical protein